MIKTTFAPKKKKGYLGGRIGGFGRHRRLPTHSMILPQFCAHIDQNPQFKHKFRINRPNPDFIISYMSKIQEHSAMWYLEKSDIWKWGLKDQSQITAKSVIDLRNFGKLRRERIERA